MTDLHRITVTINGEQREVDVEARRTLVDLLRTDLQLTGTRVGCEHGTCGACTVLLDGRPVRSCLVLGVQADGCEVSTIEGMGGEELSDLQEAFVSHRALQCGFCTSGFLMLASTLTERDERPSDAEVRDTLSSNLCRCTGYAPIAQAVADVLDTSEPDS